MLVCRENVYIPLLVNQFEWILIFTWWEGNIKRLTVASTEIRQPWHFRHHITSWGLANDTQRYVNLVHIPHGYYASNMYLTCISPASYLHNFNSCKLATNLDEYNQNLVLLLNSWQRNLNDWSWGWGFQRKDRFNKTFPLFFVSYYKIPKDQALPGVTTFGPPCTTTKLK